MLGGLLGFGRRSGLVNGFRVGYLANHDWGTDQ
jgi:hypothetical protein